MTARQIPAANRAAKTAAFLLMTISWTISGTVSSLAANSEINLYSYRQPFLIQPILDAFTRETGIDVNIVYAKKGILERLKAEGRN
ncbi:MAG: hypothetical protein H8E94_05225, partial [Alphaproteobacteria bacterium]|nr:hypothetical protein [Alphaproteobacteria bacterium]